MAPDLASIRNAGEPVEQALAANAASARALESGEHAAAVDAARTLAGCALAVTGALTGADHTITEGLREPINAYYQTFKTRRIRTPEFAKERLCSHQAPIELSCGYQRLYCSIRA